MPLYHFSEDPAITHFVPRPPLAHPDTEPFVWAIDEWHSPLYYLPRDCPRVCFWPQPNTTEEDWQRFFAYVSGRMVIAIETAWYERLITTRLYRYTFAPEPFFSVGENANGVQVTRQTVTPLSVEPMGGLAERLTAADIELRLCPSLVPLGRSIICASLNFSLIRMRNATGWDDRSGAPAVPANGATSCQ